MSERQAIRYPASEDQREASDHFTRQIDLAEPDRFRTAEPAVVGLLQVVAMSLSLLQQAKQAVHNGHTHD